MGIIQPLTGSNPLKIYLGDQNLYLGIIVQYLVESVGTYSVPYGVHII